MFVAPTHCRSTVAPHGVVECGVERDETAVECASLSAVNAVERHENVSVGAPKMSVLLVRPLLLKAARGGGAELPGCFSESDAVYGESVERPLSRQQRPAGPTAHQRFGVLRDRQRGRQGAALAGHMDPGRGQHVRGRSAQQKPGRGQRGGFDQWPCCLTQGWPTSAQLGAVDPDRRDLRDPPCTSARTASPDHRPWPRRTGTRWASVAMVFRGCLVPRSGPVADAAPFKVALRHPGALADRAELGGSQ
jgi:hypothetical protein